jgi:hypothetical protein
MNDPIKFNLILYRSEIEAGINEIIMDALMASASKQAKPKPTLAEIVIEGKEKMMSAVECVIAKHEWKIARRKNNQLGADIYHTEINAACEMQHLNFLLSQYGTTDRYSANEYGWLTGKSTAKDKHSLMSQDFSKHPINLYV